MIKRVIKLTTTPQMIENDINELINNSDIDQPMLTNTNHVPTSLITVYPITHSLSSNIGEK